MRKVSNLSAILSRVITILSVLIIFALSACSGGGDTDGGKAGDDDFEGTQYVPTDDSAGKITVTPNNDEIAVSQIEGFTVQVVDGSGRPASNLLISCDSEDGVAIIEPNTGTEITDSFGRISGRIGCEASGSFQFGCRLAVGANKRHLVRIKCTGDIPTGFAGFPGAAGGTLGGGVQVIDDGGPGGVDTDGTRIIAINAIDLGNPVSQIDVLFIPDCDGDPDSNDPEPFSDTKLQLTVVNNTNSLINFDRISYSIPNFDGTGRTFQSSALAVIGEAGGVAAISPNGGQKSFEVLAFSVIGPGTSDKFFVNFSTGNSGIPTDLGIRNVTVRASGTTSLGQRVEASASVALSFGPYNNCGAS